MKKILYSFVLFSFFNLTAQTGVGIGTTTPSASSALDITSTTKGILVPRMTQAQRTAIATPATGLMVYQTDGTAGFYYFNGTIWVTLSSSGWSLLGNAGTAVASNKVGTTDAQALSIVTNNTEAIRILSNGNVGIGTNAPSTKLHVVATSVAAQIFNDGFEDNTLPPYTTSGNANWAIQNTVVNSGTRAAKAGNITDSQTTNIDYATAVIPAQGAVLSFVYKVDSESCCDKLRFFVDGVEITNWGGSINWTTYTYALAAGAHTLRWQYSKDSSIASGTDTAYLDDVIISVNATPSLTINDGFQASGKVLTSDATGKAVWKDPAPVSGSDADWLWNSGSTNADPIYHVGNVFIGTGSTTTTRNLQVWNGTTTGSRADIGSIEYLMDDTNELRFSDLFTTQTDAGQNVGSLTNRWTAIYSANGTIQTSDLREKERIEPLAYGLQEILKLNPVSFQWKQEKEDNFIIPQKEKEVKLGLIAQEVQKIIPEAITDTEWYVDGEHPEKGLTQKQAERLGISYSEMITVTIKAIQEQQVQIEALKSQKEKLEKLLSSVK